MTRKCSLVVIGLLGCFAQAFHQDPVVRRNGDVQDSIDKFVDKLTDKLANKAFKTLPVHSFFSFPMQRASSLCRSPFCGSRSLPMLRAYGEDRVEATAKAVAAVTAAAVAIKVQSLRLAMMSGGRIARPETVLDAVLFLSPRTQFITDLEGIVEPEHAQQAIQILPVVAALQIVAVAVLGGWEAQEAVRSALLKRNPPRLVALTLALALGVGYGTGTGLIL
eukprot:gnl/MRDRNA2_/MRDRNA2_35553_c0_seq1.p1 gnl/MRDRNA2_/MRDRNA2_35553_c0~~gnl/MRDRNA2_/MRDRNA2_35553_c0_seq1.p1  ORF type:complete len:221 (+),score=20.38 gnl/MRDRNA2_/MRDRNA2_35553_c0_seq1:164-826(+)